MSSGMSFSLDGDSDDKLIAKEGRLTKSNMWVQYAILAMLFWGMCNFGFGIIAEFGKPGASQSASFLSWTVSGVIGTISMLPKRAAIKTYCRREAIWCFLSGAFACLALLAVSLAMAACPEGKGAIVAVKPTQCFIISLLSFVIYGEKLTSLQCFGMLGAIAGLAMMCMADIGEHPIYAFFLGFLCAQSFGICNFITKHVTTHSSNPISPAEAANLTNVFMGLVGVSFLVYQSASGTFLEGLRHEQSWLILVAAVVALAGFLGSICVGSAFHRGGPGGVVAIVANSQAVVVLILDVIFFAPKLGFLVLCGMGVVLSSVGFLVVVSPNVEKNIESTDPEHQIDGRVAGG